MLASLVDVAVFSCQVGSKKPDPAVYLLACDRMEVGPEECCYVGDAGSQELTGAVAIGMHSVLIRRDEDVDSDLFTIDAEDWPGLWISAIDDLLPLIESL